MRVCTLMCRYAISFTVAKCFDQNQCQVLRPGGFRRSDSKGKANLGDPNTVRPLRPPHIREDLTKRGDREARL